MRMRLGTRLGAALLAVAALAMSAGCGSDDAASSGSGGDDASTSAQATDGATTSGEGGSAPGNGDADEDGLTDADEAALGTDPANPDSDADGYLDGDEVAEGSDPLDADSGIYAGGWPYQRDKDQIVDPGFGGSPEIGSVLPHFVAYDQFGEQVDVYDFAFQGRPIVIDLSAIWCESCKDLARWLAGDASPFDAAGDYASIGERVRSGEIYWITVVFEDELGNAAGPEHAVLWEEAFPSDRVTVLADNDRQLDAYAFPGSFPSLLALGEDLTITAYDRYDFKPALDSLLE